MKDNKKPKEKSIIKEIIMWSCMLIFGYLAMNFGSYIRSSFSSMDSTEKNTGIIVVRDFSCKESIPDFTLGENSNPSENEIKNLCGCIWSSFNEKEKSYSNLVISGKASSDESNDFSRSFYKSLKSCGGLNL